MSLPSKSVFGTNQTYESGVMRSASERIADIPSSNVCLGVESGSTGRFSHSPVMTQSGLRSVCQKAVIADMSSSCRYVSGKPDCIRSRAYRSRIVGSRKE